MKRLALSTILLAAGALLASGCVYKMNIQQGNYLVAESVSQLKEGMTRSQVRFLLGTPMVPDAFDDDRWDYYYFFSSQKYQGAAQAPADCLLRGRQSRALRKPGRADPGGSRAARTRSAQGDGRNEGQDARSRACWKRMFGRDKPAETATDSKPSDSKPAPRSARIPCRLPRPLCPRPPGLLRVQHERPIDFDRGRRRAAPHRDRTARRKSRHPRPTARRALPACARAAASASATVAPSASSTCHSHCRAGVANATVQRFI